VCELKDLQTVNMFPMQAERNQVANQIWETNGGQECCWKKSLEKYSHCQGEVVGGGSEGAGRSKGLRV